MTSDDVLAEANRQHTGRLEQVRQALIDSRSCASATERAQFMLKALEPEKQG